MVDELFDALGDVAKLLVWMVDGLECVAEIAGQKFAEVVEVFVALVAVVEGLFAVLV